MASKCVVAALLFLATFVRTDAAELPRLHRNLQLLEDVKIDLVERTIELPNTTLSVNAGFPLDMTLYNIKCGELDFADITLNSTVESSQLIRSVLTLVGLGLRCTFGFDYSWTIVRGSADSNILVQDSDVALDILFESPNLDEFPPDQVTVDDCSSNIQVEELQFVGNTPAVAVLNSIESSLRDFLGNYIENIVCDLVSTFDQVVADILVAVAELLTPYRVSPETRNPLAAEQSMLIPDDIQLVNFQNPVTPIASVVDQVVEAVSTFLGGTVENEAGEVEVSLNNLLRNSLLAEDGGFNLKLSLGLSSLTNVLAGTRFAGSFESILALLESFGIADVRLTNVSLFGLDNFKELSALDEIGKYTFSSAFRIEDASVRFAGEFDIVGGGTESFDIEIVLTSLEAAASVLVALDEFRLGDIKMGTLFSIQDLPCLVAAIHQLTLTDLSLSDIGLSSPTIKGFQSSAVETVINSALDLGFVAFEGILVDTLPEILRIVAGNLVTTLGLETLQQGDTCDEPSIGRANSSVDFRDFLLEPDAAAALGGSGSGPYGEIVPFLKQFFDTELLGDDPETGLPRINSAVLSPATKLLSGTQGTVTLESRLLSIQRSVKLGNLTTDLLVGIGNVRLENIDTIQSPLILLDPVNGKAYDLENQFGIGSPSAPVGISADILVEVDSNDNSLRDEFNIAVGVDSVAVAVSLLARLRELEFFRFPITSLLNLNCWLATLERPELDEFGVRVEGSEPSLTLVDIGVGIEGFTFTMDCFDCPDPIFQTIADLLDVVAERDSGESQSSLADVFGAVSRGESSFVQSQIDRLLVEAPQKCPHSPEYDPSAVREAYDTIEIEGFVSDEAPDDGSDIYFYISVGLAAIALLAAVTVACVTRRRVRRDQAAWLKTLPSSRVHAIYEKQVGLDAALAEEPSLGFNSDVPMFFRVVVPFALVGTMGLFLAGFVMDAAEVKVIVELADVQILETSIYFTVFKIATNTFKAGGRLNGIVVILLSGVWPQVKQLATLGLWFAPTSLVTASTRGKLLFVLDILGKWTMVAVFVIIIFIAVFNIIISSPAEFFISGFSYNVELAMLPVWGIYALCVGQLFGQLTSQIVLSCQRQMISATHSKQGSETVATSSQVTEERPKSETSEKGSLGAETFYGMHHGEGNTYRIRPGVNVLLAVLGIGSVAAIVVAIFSPVMSARIDGLVGAAVEAGEQFGKATEDYSILFIMQEVFDRTRFVDTMKADLGIVVLAVATGTTVIGIPILMAFTLLLQWLYPHGMNVRSKVHAFVEILQPWQYLEVFCLTVVMTSIQLGNLTETFAARYCQDLDGVFSALVTYGVLSDNAGKCFAVEGNVEYGSVLMVGGVFMLALLRIIVKGAFMQSQATVVQPGTPALPKGSSAGGGDADIVAMIRPEPVLFSDRFSWLLQKQ